MILAIIVAIPFVIFFLSIFFGVSQAVEKQFNDEYTVIIIEDKRNDK